MRIGIIGYGHVGVTGLGLVASGKRKIASGAEWDSLYNTTGLLGTNPIVGDDHSDTYDTLNHMAKIVTSTLIDTRKVAAKLKGASQEQTLRNIWNHVYNHFQYEKDATGIEQIRRPARSWRDRKAGIDCDCMSVVISSLLHHLGISHTFRKAEYNEETGWQHVYVTVPKSGTPLDSLKGAKHVDRNKYYVLDCVVDKFDYEVPYLKKFDKVMKVQYLNGLDDATISGGISAALSASFAPSTTEQLLAGYGNEFEMLNAVASLNGVDGNLIESAFLKGLKQHLLNTRSIMKLNPALTAGLYNPTLFLARLDTLIEAFDDASMRSKVLGELGCLEDRENGLSGAEGLGFFKKIAKAVKTVAKKVGEGVKKAGQAVVKAAKAVGKFIVKYNPATIAIRAGMLLAMKINFFRQAEKLGYGLWDDKTAETKGLDANEFKKAKDAFNKVVNIYTKLGGKRSKIEGAIRAGWEKGTKKHNLVHGLDPVKRKPMLPKQQAKVAVAKTRIAAATPLLQQVENNLKQVNFKNVTRRNETQSAEDLFQAIRTNKGGIATKLSLAYKPASEASRYNKLEYSRYLNSVRNIENLVKKNGGTPQQLREAVEAGKQVAISKAQLGEVATASTAAASGVLATIASFLKKIDFKTLFKGKAESPHFDESQMKNFDVTEEMDDDTFDEGDPTNTAEPVSNILSQFTETDAIINKLTTAPAAATFTNLVPSKAKEVVEKLSDSEVAKLYNQVKSSPVVATIVNTPLAQEVIKKMEQKIAPAQRDAVNKFFQSDTGIQDAEVISSKPLDKEKKEDKTKQIVKYVAIGGGVLAAGYLLYRVSQRPAVPSAAASSAAPSTQPPAPTLSGVKKKSKTKKSQRPKQVMAITI